MSTAGFHLKNWSAVMLYFFSTDGQSSPFATTCHLLQLAAIPSTVSVGAPTRTQYEYPGVKLVLQSLETDGFQCKKLVSVTLYFFSTLPHESPDFIVCHPLQSHAVSGNVFPPGDASCAVTGLGSMVKSNKVAMNMAIVALSRDAILDTVWGC